jgi:tyrosine-specific transport protein
VSLGLFDFLSDGLKIEKKGKGHLMIALLAFLPSLLIVLFYPSIFVKALSYAGIFAIVLLILLPAFMIWSGRYYKNLNVGRYQVAGGKIAIALLIVVAFLMAAVGMMKLI